MENSCEFVMKYCKSEECCRINNALKELYGEWVFHWYSDSPESSYQKASKKYKTETYHLTYPCLLTCTDGYLKSRTIMYGQEEHYHIDKKQNPLDSFLQDAQYKFPTRIVNGKADKTQYLRTRFVIPGLAKAPYYAFPQFPLNEKDCVTFNSVLSNNVNKFSYCGQHTRVEDVPEELYHEILFNGVSCSIFLHELKILKPQRLVLLTGKGYGGQVSRDFGRLGDRIIAEYHNLSYSSLVYGFMLDREEVKELTNGIYEESLHIVIGYHPGAYMKKETRNKYYQKLEGLGLLI